MEAFGNSRMEGRQWYNPRSVSGRRSSSLGKRWSNIFLPTDLAVEDEIRENLKLDDAKFGELCIVGNPGKGSYRLRKIIEHARDEKYFTRIFNTLSRSPGLDFVKYDFKVEGVTEASLLVNDLRRDIMGLEAEIYTKPIGGNFGSSRIAVLSNVHCDKPGRFKKLFYYDN